MFPPDWHGFIHRRRPNSDGRGHSTALSPTAKATQATSGGNPNPAGGHIQFFATTTPTWTQTLLSTITVVSVTLTYSVTPASIPSDLPAEAATQFAITTPELTAQGQELDFRSPYFCCVVILLLPGIFTLILLAGTGRAGVIPVRSVTTGCKKANYFVNCKHLNTVPIWKAGI